MAFVSITKPRLQARHLSVPRELADSLTQNVNTLHGRYLNKNSLTQGWAVVMFVSILPPLTFETLYLHMSFLIATTCTFLIGRSSTSSKILILFFPLLVIYLFSPFHISIKARPRRGLLSLTSAYNIKKNTFV